MKTRIKIKKTEKLILENKKSSLTTSELRRLNTNHGIDVVAGVSLSRDNYRIPGDNSKFADLPGCAVEYMIDRYPITKFGGPKKRQRQVDGQMIIKPEHEGKFMVVDDEEFGELIAVPKYRRPSTTINRPIYIGTPDRYGREETGRKEYGVMKSLFSNNSSKYSNIDKMTHCLIGIGPADPISREKIDGETISTLIQGNLVYDYYGLVNNLFIEKEYRQASSKNIGLRITLGDFEDGTGKGDWWPSTMLDNRMALRIGIKANFGTTKDQRQIGITKWGEGDKDTDINMDNVQMSAMRGTIFPSGGSGDASRYTWTLNSPRGGFGAPITGATLIDKYEPRSYSPNISSYEPQHDEAFMAINTLTIKEDYGTRLEAYIKFSNSKDFKHPSNPENLKEVEPENMLESKESALFAAKFIGEALRDWVYLQIKARSGLDRDFYILTDGIAVQGELMAKLDEFGIREEFVQNMLNPGSNFESKTDRGLRAKRRAKVDKIINNKEAHILRYQAAEKFYNKNEAPCQARPMGANFTSRGTWKNALHCLNMLATGKGGKCRLCGDEKVKYFMKFIFNRRNGLSSETPRSWKASLINPIFPSFEYYIYYMKNSPKSLLKGDREKINKQPEITSAQVKGAMIEAAITPEE